MFDHSLNCIIKIPVQNDVTTKTYPVSDRANISEQFRRLDTSKLSNVYETNEYHKHLTIPDVDRNAR